MSRTMRNFLSMSLWIVALIAGLFTGMGFVIEGQIPLIQRAATLTMVAAVAAWWIRREC